MPRTEIYLLLTLTAFSLPSDFLEWKAVRISNYARAFPLCITAHSRLSAHYTNSSDVPGRSPLKQVVPLLPAWFPQQKSGGGGRRRDGARDAVMPSPSSPSRVARASPALPLHGFLALKPIWGQALWGWTCITRCCGALGGQQVGTQHPGPSEGVMLPLDSWGLLCDAEKKQSWSQVTLTPKDEAAVSQGKFMPA